MGALQLVAFPVASYVLLLQAQSAPAGRWCSAPAGACCVSSAPMRPLALSTVEFRTRGLSQLAVGVFAGAAALAVQRPSQAVAAIVLGSVIYGGLMYGVLYRRRLRQIFEGVRPAVSAQRELSSRTRSRTLRSEALPLLAIFLVLGIAFRTYAVVSGIAIGNGVAMILIAARIGRWETDHDLLLLREPRFRWKGTAGWGRGGGVIDPTDYYSAPLQSKNG